MKHSLTVKHKVNKIKNYWIKKVKLLIESSSLFKNNDNISEDINLINNNENINKLLFEKILLIEGLLYEVLYNTLNKNEKLSNFDLLQFNKIEEINTNISNIKQSKKTILNSINNNQSEIIE
jgi:hypothetical protein